MPTCVAVLANPGSANFTAQLARKVLVCLENSVLVASSLCKLFSGQTPSFFMMATSSTAKDLPLFSVWSTVLKLFWHDVTFLQSCYLRFISFLLGCDVLQGAGHTKLNGEDAAQASGIHVGSTLAAFLPTWLVYWLFLPSAGFMYEGLYPAIWVL